MESKSSGVGDFNPTFPLVNGNAETNLGRDKPVLGLTTEAVNGDNELLPTETDSLLEPRAESNESCDAHGKNESRSTIVEMPTGQTILGNQEEHITSLTVDTDDQDGVDDDDKQEMVNQQGVRFTASTEQQDGLYLNIYSTTNRNYNLVIICMWI